MITFYCTKFCPAVASCRLTMLESLAMEISHFSEGNITTLLRIFINFHINDTQRFQKETKELYRSYNKKAVEKKKQYNKDKIQQVQRKPSSKSIDPICQTTVIFPLSPVGDPFHFHFEFASAGI